MTDAVVPPAEKGRSLWASAYGRLNRNRAAMISLWFLIGVTLLCIAGPWFLPNAYDARFPDFTRVPPSFSAYPTAETMAGAVKDAVRGARGEVIDYTVDGARINIRFKASRPIDDRSTRYFDRSASFENTSIVNKSADGLEMTVAADLDQKFFYFGTDSSGRDLLARTLVAGRISLAIGALSGIVAVLIGVLYGATAGFLGGRTDNVMMRIVDILYSLPFIFFVIMLVVFFGRNFVLMFIAVGAVMWLDMARIVRGQTLSLKRQEFVQAAEALGVPSSGILWRHIVPNTLGPVAVYTTLLVPQVIILESFLSFLGLGVQEPLTSWGVLIADGVDSVPNENWLLFFPALFLTTTLFALNFLGDGLRDALDPKDR